jgi:hypothetical protein
VHWFYENINHFTVPSAMFLGLFSVFVASTARRKRKAGIPPPYFPKIVRAGMLIMVVLFSILFGMALAKNLG